MENLALISSKFLLPVGSLSRRRLGLHRPVSCELRSGIRGGASLRTSESAVEDLEKHSFASVSSSIISFNPPNPMPCLLSCIGSPILWIGVAVGIGVSALLSVVATKLKRQAILNAFKAVMSQDAAQDGQLYTATFSAGSPFPFPGASSSVPITSSQNPVAPQPAAEMEDPETESVVILSSDVENDTEQIQEVTNHDPGYNGFSSESDMFDWGQIPFKPTPTLDTCGTEVEAAQPAISSAPQSASEADDPEAEAEALQSAADIKNNRGHFTEAMSHDT